MIEFLSSLLGRCVDCIWAGFDVECHACVGFWRFVGRSLFVGFVRGRGCVSNRGV